MSELTLLEPVELSDAELDLVAAGQVNQGALGLVAANIGANNILNGTNIRVDALNGNQVTLTDVLSGNTVTTGIGVAVAVLSGATGVLNRFA